MPKIQAKPTKLEILGKEYEVKFTFGVLAELEERLNENPFNENFWATLSPKKTLIIIHCLIQDEAVTLDMLKSCLTFADLHKLVKVIATAMESAQPDNTGTKEVLKK